MKVLIGYDGSPYADAAMEDLQRAGLPDDTQALILSVADVWPAVPPLYREAMVPGPTELSLAVTDAARQVTQAAQDEAVAMAKKAQERIASIFPTWRTECEAVSDSPASALTEPAEAWNAGPIAIGS